MRSLFFISFKNLPDKTNASSNPNKDKLPSRCKESSNDRQKPFLVATATAAPTTKAARPYSAALSPAWNSGAERSPELYLEAL
jgi:Tfp pilus assembly protein PilW